MYVFNLPYIIGPQIMAEAAINKSTKEQLTKENVYHFTGKNV
jgi:hypothetical protein